MIIAPDIQKFIMAKSTIYNEILKQIDTIADKELSSATNILNVLAILKSQVGYFWIGLYYAKPDKLALGPYQGSMPCTKIEYGNGLCGLTAKTGKTHYENDVSTLDNYIACHPETQAEIVVPGFKNGNVHFVLDVDSDEKGFFDNDDQKNLELIAEKIAVLDEKN